MPPTCRSIVFLLMSTVLLSHSSSATIEDSVELLSDASNAQLSPNGAWSCCTKSGSCVQTSPSEPPSCAFDDDSSTRLTLAAGQRKATITVDLDPGAIIDYFEVSFDESGVMPGSVAMTLFGNDVTWTTYNNKSCQPRDRNLRKEGSLYFSCTPAGSYWRASVPEGLFSARNGSSGWLWWRNFSQLQLTIEANDADFNIRSTNSSIVITDVLLYGWNQPSDVCNCHPVGVEIADNPCDANRTCRCRVGTIGAQCVPIIFEIPRIYANGSNSGQTLYLEKTNVTGIYLQNISSLTIGNDYRCILSKINDTLISFTTVAVNRLDAYWALPISICWERIKGAESCLVTNIYFTYFLYAVVHSISPQVSIESGGITQTVIGENLDLASFPHVNVVAYKELTKATEGFYDYITRPYPDDSKDDKKCQIVNSTMLKCRIMPLIGDVKTSRDYNMVIAIALDSNSSYPDYNSCGTACRWFKLFSNPGIDIWSDDPKAYAVYDGRKTVEITGNGFQLGFGDEEYRVEVNGIPCEIAEVINNLILFYPPDISSPEDYTKKQSTVLYIGAYYSYTIGNLQYYKNWIDDPKHKNGLIGGLVGGIGGFIVLVVVIVLIVVFYRRRKAKPGLLDYEPRYTRTPGEHDGPVTEYLSDDVKAQVIKYTVPYERIELVHELGHGNFGKVFKGTLTDKDGVKQPVAIKSLHGVHLDIKDKVEFVEEAILMADFCHKHVLSLIAIVIEENVPYVVLPLMELGDLRAYVLQDGNSLNVGNLVNFCLEVAEGMEYLASRRFVHRDLAARNCMINRDKLVKVADFGLARDIFEKDYYRAKDTQRPLPVKWMAIECLSSNTEFTEKSDVWAYGVLVWELMTRGKRPYSDVDNLDLKRFLMQGRRLEKPPVAPDFIYDLMLRCWLPDRKNRPRFKDIVVELKEILMAAEESNATTHAAGEMNVAFDDGRVSYLQLSGNQRQ